MQSDQKPGGSGVVAFSFGGSAVPAASSVKAMTLGAQSLPANLAAVLVSIRNEAGETVADKRRLALTAFGAGYVSESVALSPGTYAVTEFIIVDDSNAARYATPIAGSEKADLVEHPLPVSFTVTAEDTATVALEVIEITSTTTPPQLGYAAFSPIVVIEPFALTFQVVDADTGAQIPFSYMKRSDQGPTGGWSIGGSSWLYPPAVYTFETVQTGHVYGLQVRSRGYRDSPQLSFTAAALNLQRTNVPVVTIALESEDSTATLTYAGIDGNGKHLYRARLTASEFIEDSIASAGATALSVFSFTVGFKLFSLEPSTSPYAPAGTLAYRQIAPLNPDNTYAFVPYDPAAIQERDAYKTLDADLLLSDAAHALVQDPATSLGLETYVEVLMLTDDGDGAIDDDDAFRGFESATLGLNDGQVTVQ